MALITLLAAMLALAAAMPALGQEGEDGEDDECIVWDDYGVCLLWESELAVYKDAAV